MLYSVRVRIALSAVAVVCASVAHAEVATLENRLATVSVDSRTGAMTVLDKRNGYLWQPGSGEAAAARVTIRQARVPIGPVGGPREPTVALTPDMATEAAGKTGVSAKASVVWEKSALILSVAVTDPRLVLGSQTEEQWWEKDGIEFWIGARQYGVRLFEGGANVWSSAGEVAAAKASWRRTAEGYTVDVSVPAADAPDASFEQGKSFRFALGVNDAGATGKREAQLYYPKGWQHSNTDTFATATLADTEGVVPATAARALPDLLRDLKRTADGRALTFATDIGDGQKLPAQVKMTLAPDSAEVVAEIDTPDHGAKIGNFRLFKPLALDDPNGFIFYSPYCDGIAVPVNLLTWRGRGTHCAGADLPWIGISDGKKGYMVLLEDSDDAGWTLDAAQTAKGTLLCPSIFHSDSKTVFGYPRRMRYTFFNDGGYVAACKRYRQFAKERGFLRPLRTRLAAKPELAKLPGAPDVWGAPGVKWAREAKAAGFDRMLINYDGSSADIEAMRALGYLVSSYDNYCDINGPGPGQYNDVKIPDDCVFTANGEPVKGWLTWDKKIQYYERCPALAEAAARKWIPVDLKEHPRNARFLDVTTARGLMECWSPVHPLTRTGDREASRRLAKYVGDELKLVLGGEHGRWWGADIYDYWEGMQSGGFYSWPAGHVDVNIPKTREEIGQEYLEWGIGAAKRIPLWELCFGDCVKSTWYWGDSTGHLMQAAPDITDMKDCYNILYGTLPLYWIGKPYSFQWDVPASRARLLQSYRDTCKLNEVIAFEEMLKHEWLTADRMVQRTTFSDGTRATVNFGAKAFEVTGGETRYTLPQYGFLAQGQRVLQYRAIVGGRKVTRISTPGYLFCDAGGVEHDFGVVRTAGQVTLRREGPDTVRVNFSDAQTTADLRLAQFAPGWDLASTRAISLDEDGVPVRVLGEPAGRLQGSATPVLMVCRAAARKPDLEIADSDVKITPTAPREGDGLHVSVTVHNSGQAPARGVLYLTSGSTTLAKAQFAMPGSAAQVTLDVPTKGLDGERRFRLEAVAYAADGRTRVPELVESNNSANASASITGDYSRWSVGASLEVDTGGIARLDEPVIAPVDLGAAAGRAVPAAVRVVELKLDGTPGRVLPAQFEPDAGFDGTTNLKGKLVFILPGVTPADARPRVRFLFRSTPDAIPQTPIVSWDERALAVSTPAYSTRFVDGVISDIRDRLSSAPGKVAIQAIPVSSQVTGWVSEQGKVTSLQVVSQGPARVVVRVKKSLDGGYDTDKTYTFYPRHFVVDCTVSKQPMILPSRAYYAMPGQFEDSGGTKAMMDGSGDDEGVSGKSRNPNWYAIYSPQWAHSCVALTPFDGLSYWDTGGAWGGISFTTGRTQDIRMAYVFHAGKPSAAFAQADHERLTKPVTVR